MSISVNFLNVIQVDIIYIYMHYEYNVPVGVRDNVAFLSFSAK